MQNINGYQIEQKVGEGSVGVVYKCKKNNQLFALKKNGRREFGRFRI